MWATRGEMEAPFESDVHDLTGALGRHPKFQEARRGSVCEMVRRQRLLGNEKPCQKRRSCWSPLSPSWSLPRFFLGWGWPVADRRRALVIAVSMIPRRSRPVGDRHDRGAAGEMSRGLGGSPGALRWGGRGLAASLSGGPVGLAAHAPTMSLLGTSMMGENSNAPQRRAGRLSPHGPIRRGRGARRHRPPRPARLRQRAPASNPH